jgi:hypothetical protein
MRLIDRVANDADSKGHELPDIIEVIVGVFVGILATFITILIFHALVAPRIYFSEHIRVYWLRTRNRPSYSIKMKKNGFVDLIDTQIHCVLYVKDTLKSGGKLWNSYKIPTTFSDSLLIKSNSRSIHLKLHEADVSCLDNFLNLKKFLIVGRPDSGVRFEDFFMSYEDVYIRLSVIGHDRITGVKKLYLSNKYYFNHIRSGSWEGVKLIINKGAKDAPRSN